MHVTLRVALARQAARRDRAWLDFSLVTFFVSKTKKVTTSQEAMQSQSMHLQKK